MKLVVGLGNPGNEYQNTRHNVGFIIIDNYVNDRWQKKDNYMYAVKNINGEKIIFIKPLTFMNLSGYAVQNAARFYKIQAEDILVIQDDLDLKKGSYKLKYASSSGGHNGIKSIINELGANNFSRLKIGIGSASNDVVDYVLGNLTKNDIDYLKSDIFKEIIDYYIEFGIQKAMNKYNSNGGK